MKYAELNWLHMEQDFTFMPSELQVEEKIFQAKFKSTYLRVYGGKRTLPSDLEEHKEPE